MKSSGKEISFSWLKLSLTGAVSQASVASDSVCRVECYLTKLSFGHSFGDTALQSSQQEELLTLKHLEKLKSKITLGAVV